MKLKLRDKVKRKMMIKGTSYDVWNGYAKISDLQFWDSNPRIHSLLEKERLDNTINKELIYKTMIGFKDFDKLKNQIREDQGINDPLIVCKNPINGEYTVYEGNTRLAISILLSEHDEPSKRSSWTDIIVNVLPDGTEEKVINRLIGTMQLTGKIDWRKFEEASYLYRQVKEEREINNTNQKDAFNIIKDTFGIPLKRVSDAYKTCQFMIEEHKMSYSRQELYYSYWELLAKGDGNIKHLRGAFNNLSYIKGKIRNEAPYALDKFLIKEIIKGEQIQRISGSSADGGTAFRDDIRIIADAFCEKGDVELVTDWIDGKIQITEAVERAKMGGVGNTEFDKVKGFAKWLCSSRTMKDLQNAIIRFPEIKKQIDTIIERTQIATSKLERNLDSELVELTNSKKDHLMYKLCICMALVDNQLHVSEIEKITELLKEQNWISKDISNHDVLDAIEQVSREIYEFKSIEKAINFYGKQLKGKENQKLLLEFLQDVMLADKLAKKEETLLIKQLRELWNI